ncbi:hypothetical protein A9Q98_03195 [Thalassotalea sp. 42_200_T64]|nr:hypothetical protein A9Q98_03195 [Thalassotalea sp. 42_200_T64]
MNTFTATNQQELDVLVEEQVFAQVLLDGAEFVLPTSDKITKMVFIGVNPGTRVVLTSSKDLSQKINIDDDGLDEVDQFNTTLALICQNVYVTADIPIELSFTSQSELDEWTGVTFDSDNIEIVIWRDELDDAMDPTKNGEAEIKQSLADGLNELCESTSEDLAELGKTMRDGLAEVLGVDKCR